MLIFALVLENTQRRKAIFKFVKKNTKTNVHVQLVYIPGRLEYVNFAADALKTPHKRHNRNFAFMGSGLRPNAINFVGFAETPL